VNNAIVINETLVLTTKHLTAGGVIKLTRGRKHHVLLKVFGDTTHTLKHLATIFSAGHRIPLKKSELFLDYLVKMLEQPCPVRVKRPESLQTLALAVRLRRNSATTLFFKISGPKVAEANKREMRRLFVELAEELGAPHPNQQADDLMFRTAYELIRRSLGPKGRSKGVVRLLHRRNSSTPPRGASARRGKAQRWKPRDNRSHLVPR
jgi:hypothetical protein